MQYQSVQQSRESILQQGGTAVASAKRRGRGATQTQSAHSLLSLRSHSLLSLSVPTRTRAERNAKSRETLQCLYSSSCHHAPLVCTRYMRQNSCVTISDEIECSAGVAEARGDEKPSARRLSGLGRSETEAHLRGRLAFCTTLTFTPYIASFPPHSYRIKHAQMQNPYHCQLLACTSPHQSIYRFARTFSSRAQSFQNTLLAQLQLRYFGGGRAQATGFAGHHERHKPEKRHFWIALGIRTPRSTQPFKRIIGAKSRF